MRCLIWAAVSSKPQAEEFKASLPQQVADARAVIERQEWAEIHEPLVVDGHTRSYSGISPLLDACADMPQYATLIELARADAIDLVVCRSRDRLGRTDVLVSEVEGYLRVHGVQVYSLDMPARIQPPEEFKAHRDKAGLWTAAIERARAEDEVATLQTRYQFGMRGRIKRGLHPNSLPFGYRKGPDGVGHIAPEEARLVRLIYDWYLAGWPVARIVRELPKYAEGRYLKSDRSIRRVLRNPYYTGTVGWKMEDYPHGYRPRSEWITATGLHEPIVSMEVWEQAQAERRARPGGGPRGRYRQYPLSGLVVCGGCNQTMNVHHTVSKGRKYTYYRCGRCPKQYYPIDEIERAVAEQICEWASSPESFRTALEEAATDDHQADERRALEASIEQKQTALERWTEDYERGLISRAEFYRRRVALQEQIEEAEAAMRALGEPPVAPDFALEKVGQIGQHGVDALVASWQDDDTALDTQATLRRLGFRLVLKDGTARIVLGQSPTSP